MHPSKQKLGKWGEEQASKYLTHSGYKILRRNYRCRLGEIDIIAKKDNMFIFAEVKTRTNTAYGSPAEAVSYKKQWRYEKLALYYLNEAGYTNVTCRFDILEVLVNYDNSFYINHIPNAFQAGSRRYY